MKLSNYNSILLSPECHPRIQATQEEQNDAACHSPWGNLKAELVYMDPLRQRRFCKEKGKKTIYRNILNLLH